MSGVGSGLQSRDEETRRAAVASLAGGSDALALLVEALGDESWRVRKEATLRASNWSDQARAAAVLVETLAERDNVGRRNAAVEALARMGAVALPPLLEALGPRPEHRKLIVDALGLIGDRRAVRMLVRELDDPDVNVRSAAAESLGRLGGAEAEEALARHMEGGELLFSLACLEALNTLGASLPVARIAPLLATPVLKPAALTALGCCREAQAAPLLVRYLGDHSRAVREAATIGLARLYESLDDDAAREEVAGAIRNLHEEAERLLVHALLEGAGATRRSAAAVLGLSGRPSAVRPLVLALGDYSVEEAAGAALMRLGPVAIGPIAEMVGEMEPGLQATLLRVVPALGPDHRLEALLRAELCAEDAEVRAEAARSLGEIGGPDCAVGLFEALHDEASADPAEAALCRVATRHPEAVRRLIGEHALVGPDAPRYCRVIGACRRRDDLPLLVSLLRAPAAALRTAAAEALGAQASASLESPGGLVDPLGRALGDVAPEVRAAAARALSGFSAAAVMPLLERAAGDPEAAVRAAVAWALGALATAEALAVLHAREQVEDDPLVHAVIDAALHAPTAP